VILHDPRLRAAFIATIVLSGLIVLVTQVVGEENSFPIVVSLIVFMSLLQMGLLFLWNGDTASGPLLAARRYYIDGRFEAAAEVLENTELDTASAEVLSLLGNTYRQLKRLDESEKLLRTAVERFPEDKLALYGLGKTLLVRGHYDEAAVMIERALAHDGRKNILVELTQALHYAERDTTEVVRRANQAARVLNLEQYRTLFVNYVLYNLADDNQDVAAHIIRNNREGLAYWQSEARRFADQDYGRRVAGDVMEIKAILEEDTSNHE
jgi:tetratricopeptide (TPR) repeat protein